MMPILLDSLEKKNLFLGELYSNLNVDYVAAQLIEL